MNGRSSNTPAARRFQHLISLTMAATLLALAACTAPSAESDKVPATTGTSAGTLGEPNVAEVRNTIEAANQRAIDAMLAGDMAASLASYSDNAVSMMPGMPAMRGKPAIEQGMTGMMTDIKMTAAKFTTEDVIVSGDLAVESGTFSMTLQPKTGKAMEDVGKYISIWQRQADGSWKIVRDINNTDLPPVAPK